MNVEKPTNATKSLPTFSSNFATAGSRFDVFDPQGSAGALLTSELCDAFGGRAMSSPRGVAASDSFCGFGGQWGYWYDSDSGLELLTHRFYDPGAGRFVTRDPSGYFNGIDLYAYTKNNPQTRLDSTGLEVEFCDHNPTASASFPHFYICCEPVYGPQPPVYGPGCKPQAPKPGCIGLEPGGSNPFNFVNPFAQQGEWDYPDSSGPNINRVDQNATPMEEQCVCQITNFPPTPPVYTIWLQNTCADEAKSLLEQCGINPKIPALDP